jgi:ribonuclease P protein component
MLHLRNDLSKTEKLRDKQAFDGAFAHGKRYKTQDGLFLITKNNLAHARAGIIVGKKKVKLAVKRNYIKRVFREWFRLHKQALTGLDLVFIVRQEFRFTQMLYSGEKVIQYAKNNYLLHSRV